MKMSPIRELALQKLIDDARETALLNEEYYSIYQLIMRTGLRERTSDAKVEIIVADRQQAEYLRDVLGLEEDNLVRIEGHGLPDGEPNTGGRRQIEDDIEALKQAWVKAKAKRTQTQSEEDRHIADECYDRFRRAQYRASKRKTAQIASSQNCGKTLYRD
jgi:hypothetical protein